MKTIEKDGKFISTTVRLLGRVGSLQRIDSFGMRTGQIEGNKCYQVKDEARDIQVIRMRGRTYGW